MYRGPLLILFFLCCWTAATAQTLAFTIPDTVCAGQSVSISNQTTGGTTHLWTYCKTDPAQQYSFTDLGNPGGLFKTPPKVYVEYDGANYVGFVLNYVTGGANTLRLNFGNNIYNNTPTVEDLGVFGSANINGPAALKLIKVGVNWYGFMVSNDWNGTRNLSRLDFGTSLLNTPSVTQFGTLGGVMKFSFDIEIVQDGGIYYGFIGTNNFGLIKLNFGTSITNTPTASNIGSFGVISRVNEIHIIKDAGNWYMFALNDQDPGNPTALGNTIAKLSFGSSLNNTPTGINYGNPNGYFDRPNSMMLFYDCSQLKGYVFNAADALIEVLFPNNVLSTSILTFNRGGNTLFDGPNCISNIFNISGEKIAFITNGYGNTLMRANFNRCNNAGIPLSTLYTPPAVTFNTFGTYNITLTVNDGQPTEAQLCKTIVVEDCDTNIVATFTAPDTVCLGQLVNITNQTQGGTTFEWDFCLENPSQSISGSNMGVPSGINTRPTGIQIFKEGNNWVGFIGNDAGAFVSEPLQRIEFGNSLLNAPTISDMPTFGIFFNPLIARFYFENGHWYALSFTGRNGTNGFDKHFILMDFGSSLFNTPVLLRDFTNLGGGVAQNDLFNGITIEKSGNNVVAFVSTVSGPIHRINFGSSITNPTPTFTNMGNFGLLTRSNIIKLVFSGGNWYGFAPNDGYPNNPANDRLIRLDFGNSLLNTPTAVNLGNPNGVMNRTSDIIPYYECETFKIYGVNEANRQVTNFSFPNGIGSNTVTGQALGNVGSFTNAGGVSQILTEGYDKYFFVVNTGNNSISRIKVTKCNNAGIPSYTSFNPPPVSFNQLGTFNVLLTVNEGAPTESRTCRTVVVVDTFPKPIANANSPVCVGSAINLTLSNFNSGLQYSWTGPNGFSSNLPQPTIPSATTASAGQYIVSATGPICGTKKDTVIVSVTNLVVNLGRDTSLCAGNTITLNATVSGGQYLWSTGAVTPTIQVAQPGGTYWVRVTQNGCIDRDTIVISYINPPASFSIGNDTTYCGSFSRVLNAGTTATWSTGATATSITVTQPGTYWAQVTNTCGSRRDSIVISQASLPFFNLGNDTSYCSSINRVLTTGISQTTWSTGQSGASITVTQPGLYWAQVTNVCGSFRDTIRLNITGLPNLNIGNDTTYCGSFSRVLNAGTTATWSTGVTATSITVTQPGTYWAQVTNTCGSRRDSIVISQASLPSFNLGNDTSYCSSINRVLTTGIAQTTWSTGQSGASITVTQAGLYWAQVTNACGSFRDTIRLNITGLPNLNIGNDTTYCGTFSRVLNAGTTASWSTGATATSITVTQPGTYWAQAGNNCGSVRDSIVISQLFLPGFNIGDDTVYCSSFTRTLSSGNVSATWSTGQTGTSIVVNQPGPYWAEASNGCGTFRDSIQLTLDTAPLFDLGSDTLICNIQSFGLQTGYAQTNWSTGQAGAGIQVNEDGVYWASVTNICGSYRDTIAIDFSALVPADLGEDRQICEGDSVILTIPQGDVEVTWSTGSIGYSIVVYEGGEYWVSVQNECGEAIDTVLIEAASCEQCNVGVPSAFTPNSDGQNDLFRPIFTCPIDSYIFMVANRWGEIVFRSETKGEWNGIYKGKEAPLEVYVWYLEYVDPNDGQIKRMKGPVTLLK